MTRPNDPRARVRVWTAGLTFLLLGTVGAFFLGVMAARGLLTPATIAREDPRTAPDLIGRDLDAAREESPNLDVLGLAYGAEVDSGEVLFQFPPSGMPLTERQPVEVLIGGGAGRRRVPDLSGLAQPSALTLLERAGLRVSRIEKVEAGGYEEGTVVSTTPPAGTPIRAGDSLVIAVSSGGTIVEVPDLAGKSEAEAALILRSAQLVPGKLTVQEAAAADSVKFVVVSQDPPPGRLARSGTAVDLRLGRLRGAGAGDEEGEAAPETLPLPGETLPSDREPQDPLPGEMLPPDREPQDPLPGEMLPPQREPLDALPADTLEPTAPGADPPLAPLEPEVLDETPSAANGTPSEPETPAPSGNP